MTTRFGRSTLRRLAIGLTALVALTACGEDVDVTTADDNGTETASSTTGSAADGASSSDTDAGSDVGAETSSSCFDAPDIEAVTVANDPTSLAGTTLTLVTHDSFLLSEGTLGAFTDQTGIEVEQVAVGDAGTLVSQAILTKDNPTADVLFGIDNATMCRGLEADLFVPYESAELVSVDDALELDPHHRLTPIDYGDVCVNYWTDQLPGPEPVTLDDLIAPDNADQFVTQNPETSSPGLAFLLATVAAYGEDGWEDYWRALVDNGVEVTAGWSDAYYGDFVAGGGDRSIVTSYASSPVAEVVFADPPVDAPPTGVLADSCFRQIEFAGILTGTSQPQAAALLIEFMLSSTWQEDVPLNMFVYPARSDATVPDVFTEFGPLVDDALQLDPETIEANRDDWTQRWTEIVLG